MKILRITSLGFETGGGVENGIMLLQSTFERMGHTVKVLASDEHPELPHFNEYSFPAFSQVPGVLKPIFGCFYPASYRALKKVLDEFQPDLVQLHTMSQVSPSVLFALRRHPTVLTIHGAEDFTRGLLVWAFPLHFFKNGIVDRARLTTVGWLHYLYHRYVNGLVYRLGFRHVDAFLVLSRYMQTELAKEGIAADYIPNATRLFTPVPIDRDGRTILYVGRLEKIKGVQHLIQALKRVLRTHSDARLLIAGDGNYRSALHALVSELGLTQQVTILGHQTREELYARYQESTVLVVPSVWPEPFGKVGIEAMSVGRPVIGSDVGGVSEWLKDGETGFLVPPADADALAEKIGRLFNDRALLLSLSRQAAEWAQTFSIDTHAKKVIALYEEVVLRYRHNTGS